MTLKEFYDAIGGSYDDAIFCFKTEERIKKYLRVFAKDDSFPNLQKSLMASDFKQAFVCAHSIKGTAKTLCLAKLGGSATNLAELLRHYNGEDYEILLRYVRDDYKIVMAYLKELD